MRFAMITFALVLTVAGLTGCSTVPQGRYDDLMTSYRTLQEENVALQGSLEEARAANGMLRTQLTEASNRLNQLTADNGRLRAEIERLGGDYSALVERLNNMPLTALPPDLDAALKSLAAAHPELLTYDSATGTVRFASDFTFDLGSAELKAAAGETIRALATIVNSPAASGFEVHVVGHTDNVPISRPETRAKHPTNRHLSVHRAISVGNALSSANVDPRRIMVAGYGEYRPIVANTASGAAQNRRVEVHFMAMREPLPPQQPANTGGSSAPAGGNTDTPDPMK